MPTNQLAPPDLPGLFMRSIGVPNTLGPPDLQRPSMQNTPPLAAPPPADGTMTPADVWSFNRDNLGDAWQAAQDPATWREAAQNYGQGMLMGSIGPEGKGFTAYHGSPHAFDQFDLSKIGTGEGAQAYGHGMYLADSEGVARSYRDALSGGSSPMPGASDYVPGFTVNGVLPPTGMAGHAAMDTAIDMHGLFNYMDMYANKPSMSMFWKQGDPIHPDFDARPSYVRSINYLKDQIENRIAGFQDRLGGQEPNGVAERDMAALSDYYNTHVRDATPYDVQKRPPGHMYEVNVNADPAKFLDWDAPLSDQHPDVQAALHQTDWYPYAQEQLERNSIDNPTGRELHNWLLQDFDPPEAAAMLHQTGIPGIRYLDQGSRGTGTGTKNSVVFDAATMNIIRRYGLAGLLGGGAAAAATQQPSQ